MVIEQPVWLNAAFLSTVIQEGGKKTAVKVLNFSIKRAVDPGENYTSVLYRVQVTYREGKSAVQRTDSLIVKTPFDNENINISADSSSTEGDYFMGAEPRVYAELLPALREKINCEFGPRSIFSTKDLLVMQDLKMEGFEMCDKIKQLDFVHSQMVIKTLAKFHAASVACHYDDPDLIQTIGKEMFNRFGGEYHDTLKSWAEASVKETAKYLNTFHDLKPTVNLLLNRVDQLWASVLDHLKPNANRLNVLTHGDCWTNNMMFKHESGLPVDIRLVDFQALSYGSPVLDLHYFFWTSVNENVLKDKQQELYDIYLQTLNKALKELGREERLTPEQLQEDLRTSIDWVIMVIWFARPFMMCQVENAIHLDTVKPGRSKLEDDVEKYRKMYTCNRYRSRLLPVVRVFQDWVLSFS